MIKNKELSYFIYKHMNNLYGRTMPKKLPVGSFEWVESISQFNEDVIKCYNENNDIG